MTLLVFTQIVDKNDTNLGFFHDWLELLAKKTDRLLVVCLKKGVYSLPANVEVLSLGKEEGVSRFIYLKRFYQVVIGRRREYTHVFVHMNPEYIVLGGPLWWLWGKKVLLWYTHKAVNLRLRLATLFATKVFTASPESFRLPSKKVEVVGHGINVDRFSAPRAAAPNGAPRLLFVGRITPVKDLETIIQALDFLRRERHMIVPLDVVGEPITEIDKTYDTSIRMMVQKKQLAEMVQFLGGKAYGDMPMVYASHHILIHTSRTGSVDKVVLEALAAGLAVATSSEAYQAWGSVVSMFPANDSEKLAQTIEKIMKSGMLTQSIQGREFVKANHSLDRFVDRIVSYFHL